MHGFDGHRFKFDHPVVFHCVPESAVATLEVRLQDALSLHGCTDVNGPGKAIRLRLQGH